MKEIAEQLKEVIEKARGHLLAINPEEAATKPAPESWSKKEVIGHLIDSAANNHQRFVRAMYDQALSFPPYDQNAWAASQHCDDIPWEDLLELWYAYNRHLSHIIARIPPHALANPCNVGRDEPVTLRFVIEDYLRHLRHHLARLSSE